MRQIKNKTTVFSTAGTSTIECGSTATLSDSAIPWTERLPYSLVNGSPRGENADYTVGQRLLSSRGDTLTAAAPPVRAFRSRTFSAAGPPRCLSFEEILRSVLQSESGEIVQRAF